MQLPPGIKNGQEQRGMLFTRCFCALLRGCTLCSVGYPFCLQAHANGSNLGSGKFAEEVALPPAARVEPAGPPRAANQQRKVKKGQGQRPANAQPQRRPWGATRPRGPLRLYGGHPACKVMFGRGLCGMHSQPGRAVVAKRPLALSTSSTGCSARARPGCPCNW